MQFQKTTEHAIRVLIYLAQNEGERFSTNILHQTLDIPYKYLGRLMHIWAQAGLVNVLKGKNGGYALARPSKSIFLAEIVELTEGLKKHNRCILGFAECSDKHPCALHERWLDQQKAIMDMLNQTSLFDLKNQGFLNG